MEYTIRDARIEDMEQVLNLVQELANYEKEPDAVEITKDDLIKDGFGEQKLFHCYLCNLVLLFLIVQM